MTSGVIASLRLFVGLFLLYGLSACALLDFRPETGDGQLLQSNQYPDLLIVKSKPGDSFSILAKRYLNDSSKGWLISEFNDLSVLETPRELLIPLEAYRLGGLTSRGYQTVPILTYHNFSRNKSDKMTVLKSDFEEQMSYLREHGYHVISMRDFIEFLDFQRQIPEKSVLITIDDGWRSFYTIAYPILKRYGYPATLFIYTDLINGRGNHLNWSEIKEMSENLVEMQCHTQTHRYLTKRKSGESYLMYVQEIEKELKNSTQVIETAIQKKVDLLAYPYGESNHLVAAYTRKNGFRGAFSVNPEPNPFFVPHYKINRTMVLGDYDIGRFKRCLKIFNKLSLQ